MKNNYRYDIQAVRGICCLVIFIYHYNKKYITSGFLGVDIFFLISGYVNTISIINKKSIGYIYFYFHRAIRLVPVSWVVLVISSYITSRMNIIYRNKLYLDIASSDLSFSNYRFMFLSTNYLSSNEKTSIVLHYWSLSVEEQFYYLFPLYINKLLSNKYIYFTILLFSYLYCAFSCYYYNIYTYFSTISRIWELLYGITLLAFNINKFNGSYITYFPLFLLFSMFFINDIEKISPLFSIVPLSIVLIILNSYNTSNILTSKLLQHIGNISYPFYLLHFIIIKEYHISIVKSFILSYIASYILSYFQFLFLKKVNNICIEIIIVLTFHISIILPLAKLIKETKKILSNNRNELLNNYNNIMNEWKKFYFTKTICPYNTKVNHNILYKNVALIIGDSHIEQWFYVLLPFLFSYNYIPIEIYAREFNVIRKDLTIIKSLLKGFTKIEIVIIGYYMKEEINETRLIYFNNYMHLLLNYTKKVIVVQDNPHFSTNPNECIHSKIRIHQCYGVLGVNATIINIPIIKNNRVNYIDMHNYLCDENNVCNFVIKKMIVYRDKNHLSMNFASTLYKNFLNQIKLEKLEKKYNISKWYKCLDYKYINEGFLSEKKKYLKARM